MLRSGSKKEIERERESTYYEASNYMKMEMQKIT
jgi:hypothetical protein